MASVGRGAKAKGSNFERTIAKQLTEWWTGDGEFTRTPASGGLRWQNRNDTIGDISSPDNFTHTIECKNREDWKFKEFFTRQEGTKEGENIACWWYQACDEAERAERSPWLILKKNYVKPLLIWSGDDTIMRIHYKKYLETFAVSTKISLKDTRKYSKVFVCDFDTVLSILEPNHFMIF